MIRISFRLPGQLGGPYRAHLLGTCSSRDHNELQHEPWLLLAMIDPHPEFNYPGAIVEVPAYLCRYIGEESPPKRKKDR